MESDLDPAATVDELERERLRPYLTDETPQWFAPAFGVVVAVFIASHDIDNVAVRAAAIILYTAAVGAIVGLKVRRNGFQPKMTGMPGPIVRHVLLGVAALSLVIAVVIPLALLSSFRFRFTVAGIVLGVTTWVWLRLFTVRYERLAARLAAEAGISLP